MNIHELVDMFYHKLNGPDDATAEDSMRVVVRALRDETRHMTLNRDSLEELFTQILGDAGEKVAGGSTREDGQALLSAASTPATDAAPAVCVWAYDVRTDPWPWRSSCGNGWRDSKRTCPQCKKQVKFTEAK